MFNESNGPEEAIVQKLQNLDGVKWEFVSGDTIPKTPQDVLVGTWLKQALIKLNPAIQANPDYADEVIYKLRAVFLDAKHTGLVKANENFYEWLKAEKSLPFGENGEHVTSL